ncbi:MAG: hypothetical protein MJY74_01895 [Bacteroidaceae bacterium]|nr:hypothetical protein [Bacteroidaceae bacterium]
MIDSINKLFSGLEEDSKALLENETDRLRLRTVRVLSVVLSALITYIFIALILLATLMFLTLALGQWLGVVLGNTALGYLIVGGIFLIILLVLLVSRSRLFINRFVSMFIKLFYSE